MLIYRVEDNEGNGVYRSYLVDSLISQGSNSRHPSPDDDSILYDFTSEHFFGFASVSHYHNWFHEIENRITAADNQEGFLCVYDVPMEFVTLGQKQLIFIMAEATLIEKLSLDHFDRDLQVSQDQYDWAA